MTAMITIVSANEAATEPYPYVFVNQDGTVRELHLSEQRYLQTPFAPSDSGRPYIKQSFQQKDGWGSIAGFCHRSFLPNHLHIAPAPAIDPNPPMSREELIAQLKQKMVGFEAVENGDGSITMKRANG